MDWRVSSYSITLIFFSVIPLLAGGVAWQRRQVPGSLPLALFLFAVSEWSLFQALESAALDVPAKVTFAKLEYLGITTAPVLLLWFALEFSRQKKLISRPVYLAFAVIPIAILLLAFTNEWHHLIWTDFTPVVGSQGNILLYGHGVAFWIAVAYAYLLILTASILILRSGLRFRHLYRSQAIALILAIPLPWIGNILYVFNLGPSGEDLTPLGFGVTGVILAWGLYRLQLFDLVPVARDRVIEGMADCLMVVDLQRRVVDVNPATLALLARVTPLAKDKSLPDPVGRPAHQVLGMFPELVSRFREGKEDEFELRSRGGDQDCDFEVRLSALHDRTRGMVGWMAILHDITDLNLAREDAFRARDQALAAAAESSRLYEQMKQMATIDTLTGLNTRRHFFALANAAFERAAHDGRPVTAIMIDLDHFKQVNDLYGHSAGDQMLQVVARACLESLRRLDIIGRYGGEEIVVLLPETSLIHGVRVAERLRARIAGTSLDLKEGSVQITASMGLAESVEQGDTLESLIARADQALLTAKQAGRNQVQCYNG